MPLPRMTNGGGGIRAVDWNQRIIPALNGGLGESASDEESVNLGSGRVTFSAHHPMVQPGRFQLNVQRMTGKVRVSEGTVFGPLYDPELTGDAPEDCSAFPIRGMYPFQVTGCATSAPRMDSAYFAGTEYALAISARNDFWVQVNGGWGACPLGVEAEETDPGDPETGFIYRLPIDVRFPDGEDVQVVTTEEGGMDSHTHDVTLDETIQIKGDGPVVGVYYFGVGGAGIIVTEGDEPPLESKGTRFVQIGSVWTDGSGNVTKVRQLLHSDIMIATELYTAQLGSFSTDPDSRALDAADPWEAVGDWGSGE